MREETSFVHRISKGSRFNQIYIPKNKAKEFEIGDIVEVRLLKKEARLYYSKNLRKLSKFKQELIKNIFSFLSKFKGIKQIFVFGSFLTKEIDYNDIDILLITNKEKDKEFDNKVYESLIKEFNLKFHVISSTEAQLIKNLKFSPMNRSMLSHFVSNKKFHTSIEREIDKNHLKYLLMMPEDLLKVNLSSGKVYYDSLRRLITIESFLKDKEITHDRIENELEELIEKRKLEMLKKNLPIEGVLLKEVKEVIKIKLKIIKELIKNG